MFEFPYATTKSARMCAAGVSDHRGHEGTNRTTVVKPVEGGELFSLSLPVCLLIPVMHFSSPYFILTGILYPFILYTFLC
jgi:hypothetical protein